METLPTIRPPAFPRYRPAAPRSALGFTFVEMLVVLIIVAALSAYAMTVFTQYSASRTVRVQMGAFTSDVRLTRSEAIKRSQNVTMCRSNTPEAAAPACDAAGDWTSGWIVFEDRGNRGQFESASDTLIKVQPALPRGNITTGARNVFTFSNTGMPVGQVTATVQVRPSGMSETKAKKIGLDATIAQTGRIALPTKPTP